MAVFTQQFHDRIVGFPDMLALEDRRTRQIHPAPIDRVDLGSAVAIQQAVLLAHGKVFLTVPRCGMDRAGAILGRHMVTQQDRNLAFGVERVLQQLQIEYRA